MIKDYKDLIVWKKSYSLSLLIYKITKAFPNDERYGLASQMRRCGVSIVSNIAEGDRRQYIGEYVQFLYVSFGSCSELETQIMIARDLEYLKDKELKEIVDLITEISKMLISMISKLKNKV